MPNSNNGLRRRVARELTELTSRVGGGRKSKRAPNPVREAVDRLEATVSEMRAHVGHGNGKGAGRKRSRRR